MDPPAIYRGREPYDTASLLALPAAEKDIPIPVMLLDGTVIPQGSKLIWP